MHAGGQFTHARAEFRRKVENGRQIITIRSRSAAEARKMTSGLKRKGTVKHASFWESESYPRGMIKMDLDLGDRESICSIVKSALALAFDSDVDPRRCADARDYLLSEDAAPIHGLYYDNDPVLDRPPGVPFHCVAVRGDAESNELLAYVEFFGCWRFALCLDRTYAGPDFVNCCAIDPVEGTPLDLQINLDFASDDIPLAHDRALLESPAGSRMPSARSFLKPMRLRCAGNVSGSSRRPSGSPHPNWASPKARPSATNTNAGNLPAW